VTAHNFLIVFGLACFLLGAWPGSARVNLVALGLAAWLASTIVH